MSCCIQHCVIDSAGDQFVAVHDSVANLTTYVSVLTGMAAVPVPPLTSCDASTNPVLMATAAFTTTNGVVLSIGDQYIQLDSGDTWGGGGTGGGGNAFETIENPTSILVGDTITAGPADTLVLHRSLSVGAGGPGDHLTGGELGVAAMDSGDTASGPVTASTAHNRAVLASFQCTVNGVRSATVASSQSNAVAPRTATIASNQCNASGGGQNATIASTQCGASGGGQTGCYSSFGSDSTGATRSVNVGSNFSLASNSGSGNYSSDNCDATGAHAGNYSANDSFATSAHSVVIAADVATSGATFSAVIAGSGGTTTDIDSISLCGGAATTGGVETFAHGTPTGGLAAPAVDVGFRGVVPQPPRVLGAGAVDPVLVQVVLALQEQGLAL